MEFTPLQLLFNSTVETFENSVGLGQFWRADAAYYLERGAEQGEPIRPRYSRPAPTEDAMGERFSDAHLEDALIYWFWPRAALSTLLNPVTRS
ncbi:MAG: hypothetical protein MJH10_21490 [Epibacterium sp.]|nr:hypothetical protein [Epibacterium sp.]